MRYAALVLALAGAALLTGCSSLISLNPFVADGQTTTDPRLVGTWIGAGSDDKSGMAIQQKGPIYTIHYSDEKDSIDFECRLTRVGDAELMDVITTSGLAFGIPVHMAVRVWPESGKLKWVFLESDWFRQQAKQSLATQPSSDATLITTQGDPVVQFLKKFGADARAYGETNVLVKK
jgi:hypothetical protein